MSIRGRILVGRGLRHASRVLTVKDLLLLGRQTGPTTRASDPGAIVQVVKWMAVFPLRPKLEHPTIKMYVLCRL